MSLSGNQYNTIISPYINQIGILEKQIRELKE
jgi:hypothetical protein